MADLHLGTENTEDKNEITQWINDTINEHTPDSIIFAGDIFELILPAQHSIDIRTKKQSEILKSCIDSWNPLFKILRDSKTSSFHFINGEHDYEIIKPELENIIKKSLSNKKITVSDHHYDSKSSSLIMHGHQFDYNRIYNLDGRKISCVDTLTVAINNYFSQHSGIRKSTKEKLLSYWYAPGMLPDYILALNKIFGIDKKKYGEDIAKILKSEETKEWISLQHSIASKMLGYSANLISNFPDSLLMLKKTFAKVSGRITDKRINHIFNGKFDRDIPYFCNEKKIKNLILGHAHTFEKVKYQNGVKYSVPSPRIHTRGIENNNMVLNRDLGYVLIDGENVSLVNEHFDYEIPLENYKKK